MTSDSGFALLVAACAAIATIMALRMRETTLAVLSALVVIVAITAAAGDIVDALVQRNKRRKK